MPFTAAVPPANSASKAAQQIKPQPAEARKPQGSSSSDEAAKARQAQQLQAQQQAQKSGHAKPVVNAEGHKTGQVISVTA